MPAVFNVMGWAAVVVRNGTSPEGLPIVGVRVPARLWLKDAALAAQEGCMP